LLQRPRERGFQVAGGLEALIGVFGERTPDDAVERRRLRKRRRLALENRGE